MVARWQQPGRAWCAVAASLLIGSLVGRWTDPHLIDWQPALATWQPWRWWTAAFVHYSPMHIIGNLTGLALACAFGWAARVPASAALAWFVAWPLTHWGLWLEPGLRHYGGLSGVVHAGVTIVIVHLMVAGTRGQKAVGGAVLIGLLAKILTETPWRGPLQHPQGWDIAIAPIAHVTGLLAGMSCAAVALLWQRRQHRQARHA